MPLPTQTDLLHPLRARVHGEYGGSGSEKGMRWWHTVRWGPYSVMEHAMGMMIGSSRLLVDV